MMCNKSHFLLGIGLLTLAAALGCGGTVANSPLVSNNEIAQAGAANVVPIVVDAGPASYAQTNLVYVSVTICLPGTESCQAIDDVLVDTGSEGLRLLSSALTLPLSPEIDAAGSRIAECAQFLGGYTWGAMKLADVKLGGEKAKNVPIQVIGDSLPVPTACANTGTSQNSRDALGANGILGIGPFRQDCGATCVATSSPGFYYACSAAGCAKTQVTLAQQAQNPVWMFPVDNNGTILQLPAIADRGAARVEGALVFGIGTQANNSLGSANVLTLDSVGNLRTIFAGKKFAVSYIDSGSNGLYFLDTALTGIPECSTNSIGFYCPNATQALSATAEGLNGVSAVVQFAVANTNSLGSSYNAFNNLAGPNPNSFDWGLPFFFGRNVFTAIEGQDTPAGKGPLVAF